MSEDRISRKERRAQKGEAVDPKKELVEWIVALVSAVAIGLFLHFFVFQFVQVEGPSMQPTLYTGERLFCTPATYLFRQPERGEIVITNYPNRGHDHFVKRVIALPGEKVAVHDGCVWINGTKLDESNYLDVDIYYDMEEITVPEDCVFVMGDNRNDSSDSHSPSVGPLKLSMLRGKVQAQVWPFSKFHIMETPFYDLP